MSTAHETILPIAELSPYLGSKWIIKAKITEKGPTRVFKRGGAGTEGKVFSVDLADAAGGEIRATFFNDAATKFADMLQVGKIFNFSRGSLKVANKQFNPTSHRYELTFERDAQITEVTGVVDDIKTTFTFVDLRTVQGKSVPCRIDLCGIVTQARPLQPITTKDGRELVKRDISVVDDTAVSMEVTLWGDKGKLPDADFEGFPVIALKAILIRDWSGGRSGGSIDSTKVMLRPQIPEAARLHQWWTDSGGSTQKFVSLRIGGSGSPAEQCTVAQLRVVTDQLTEQPQFFSMTARLSFVQMKKQGEHIPLHYNTCAEMREGERGPLACNRRVDESGFCGACDRAGKTALRMNVRCKYADFTGDCWLTTFNEAAEEVLGMNALKIAEIDGTNCTGRDQLETALRKRFYLDPVQLKIKGRVDTWQGEQRANVMCVGAAPVNRREHGRKMMSEIRKMLE